ESASAKKKPSKGEVIGGLVIALMGVGIGAFAIALPMYLAKQHAKGTVYVSLLALIASPTVVLHGLALALSGARGAARGAKAITWIGFLLGIVLCIALFSRLFDFGYGYK